MIRLMGYKENVNKGARSNLGIVSRGNRKMVNKIRLID